MLPPFIVLSGDQETAYASNSLFTGLDPGSVIVSNDSGSMKKSLYYEGHPEYEIGTFRNFVDFLIRNIRIRAQIPKPYPIIGILDNHSSRLDVSALELLQKEGIHLITIPPNTSWCLQLGDTRFVNQKIQEEKKKQFTFWKQAGVAISPHVALRCLPSCLGKVSSIDVFCAAEAVGFRYDASKSRVFMTSADVEAATSKFAKIYLDDYSARLQANAEANQIFGEIQALKSQALSQNNWIQLSAIPDCSCFFEVSTQMEIVEQSKKHLVHLLLSF
jgi:hypothetical protein